MRSHTNPRNWKQKLNENRTLIRAAAVILVIIAAAVLFVGKENNDTISIQKAGENGAVQKAGAETPKTGERQRVLYIDMEGEVKRPGVYEMKPGARIFEAVRKAGGLTGKADTRTINQAEKVTDGQLIVIPRKGRGEDGTNPAETGIGSSAGTGTTEGSTGGTSAQGLININTASEAELQKIPGVGPVTAGKIIAYRTQNGRFRRKEDLKNVSGIGEKTFGKMESMITV